ncbi:adenine glycosylase [Neisseria arctica]|uniref:Adenine DNA glycosylase n=1 Tax=Neisseria arctica TaxID=1470200 RepID=A0A0J0YQF5_9NEIS|nr:A/G-specific adenine glycosylase [Neisseria arctica]KLT72362.1 adenine glycosylase [Neisseria arctica]UOO85931.1 A/G-specific adenine glycosylase [Neisseria arctica]
MSPTLDFSTRLIRWQRSHGRNNLPWQVTDPYRVWLSEIMLQQTQVSTVLDYYPRFIERFPNIQTLAHAPQDEVLSLWQGLGYYSRARNLHKAAQQVIQDFGGTFPQTRLELQQLCGVGRSTAAAISAFSFRQRETILDGNVKRVLCRVFALDGDPTDKKFENSLWALAESLLPEKADDMPAYTQGLMDLGATCCKRSTPLCHQCPMADICQAKAQNRTHELPRKKNTTTVKNLPLYWLILEQADRSLFLQKRPSSGIWGGLYCVPCFEDLHSLYRFAEQCGISADELEEQAAITHRLTHRLLLITPFKALTTDAALPSELSDGIWVNPSHLQNYGIPKPMNDYLKQKQYKLF